MENSHVTTTTRQDPVATMEALFIVEQVQVPIYTVCILLQTHQVHDESFYCPQQQHWACVKLLFRLWWAVMNNIYYGIVRIKYNTILFT